MINLKNLNIKNNNIIIYMFFFTIIACSNKPNIEYDQTSIPCISDMAIFLGEEKSSVKKRIRGLKEDVNIRNEIPNGSNLFGIITTLNGLYTLVLYFDKNNVLLKVNISHPNDEPIKSEKKQFRFVEKIKNKFHNCIEIEILLEKKEQVINHDKFQEEITVDFPNNSFARVKYSAYLKNR